MTMTAQSERALIHAAVVRMRARIMAVVIGLAAGTGVLIATVWLLVRGGPNVGEHLGLLRNYFPGFTVTWPGAFVGFFWAALAGAALGFTVAWIYNQIVEWRAD